MKNLEVRGNVEHAGKGKSGLKATKMNAQKKRLLLKAAESRVGASLCVVARRFGLSHRPPVRGEYSQGEWPEV